MFQPGCRRIFVFGLISLLIIGLSGPLTYAMYFPEAIDDDLIKEITKLAEEYRQETNYLNIARETGHVPILFKRYPDYDALIALEIRTPYFSLLIDAQEKARRYMILDEEEAKKILEKDTFMINQTIISDERSDVRKDGLHLVLKVPTIDQQGIIDYQEKKIIQPHRITHAEDSYMGDLRYMGFAMYEFKLKDLPNLEGEANYEITVIFISNIGEKRISVDLSDIP